MSARPALLTLAVIHNPNRLARFLAFLDVEGNRSGGTYQLWQAILAFAAGGVDGVGLGQGRQQNSFLPEVHTDFIFAVIGEELGLAFTIGVVVLFAILFAAGLLPPAQGAEPVSSSCSWPAACCSSACRR